MNTGQTLVHTIQQHAAASPDRRLYTFLADGESESASLTYGELAAAARAAAAALRECADAGDRAMLLFPVDLEYLIGFFGCLFAGIVAVPAYPPKADRRSGDRIRAMIEDCRPRLVLTRDRLRAAVERALGDVDGGSRPRVIATDAEWPLRAAVFEPVVAPDALAFLQYTSASTGDAKGVRVTHANLMANQRMIREAMAHDEDSHFVSWLPPYHDMGLVGNLLQPLYLGSSCVFMPPSAFIQKPLRWLAAISKYRAKTSGAPNFAYDLCVKRVSPGQDGPLDLSTWSVAYCGAEAVDAGVFERFCARFEPCGFRRAAFYPCYGLAEATLMASGSDPREAPAVMEVHGDLLERGVLSECASGAGRRLVGCGRAPSGSDIRIVDPETKQALADGEIGEIWVTGPHVADGYWRPTAAANQAFDARLAGGSPPYLRTGDLGALLRDELYVVGRIKEVIIHHGRNLHPADIESVVSTAAGGRIEACAAFAIPGDATEDLAVVVEVPRRGWPESDAESLGDAIARDLYRAFDVAPARLVFARAGAIPRTTSGKKQRLLCSRLLLAGELDAIVEWRSASRPRADAPDEDLDTRLWLATVIHTLTGVPIDRLLNEPGGAAVWGLESLKAVEVLHRIERRSGTALPVALLYEAPSLAAVAEEIERRSSVRPVEQTPAGIPAPDGRGTDLPVTPNQEAVWFSQQIAPASPAFHLAWALRFSRPLDPDRLRESVRTVVARHDGLRSVFELPADGPLTGRTLPAGVVDYAYCDDGREETEAWIRRECDRPFSLDRDLLVRVRHRREPEGDVVAFALHHLIADLWSCSLFCEEVVDHYLTGSLAERSAPIHVFASHVRAAEREDEDHGRYWRARLANAPTLDPVDRLTVSTPRPPAGDDAGSSVSARLDRATSADLRNCARRHGVSPHVLLLTYYGIWMWSLSGLDDFLTGCLSSGRTRAMFSRTQGLLANPFAVRFRVGGGTVLEEVVAATRDQVLGALAHEMYPFPAVVREAGCVRRLGRTPLFQNMFVYHQLASSAWLSGSVMPGDARPVVRGGEEIRCVPLPAQSARFDFTLYAMDDGGRFCLDGVYRTALFERAVVAGMIDRFVALVGRAAAMPPASLVADLAGEGQPAL